MVRKSILLAFVLSCGGGSALAVSGVTYYDPPDMPWVGVDFTGLPCKGGEGGFGPWDYTNPSHRGGRLHIVEGEHFNKDVERLIKGKSSWLAADLDYTIRAFPNHHRALNSMIRYATDGKTRRPLRTKPECYLQRAVAFQPKDGVARLLFASFLHKVGRLNEALKHYRKAIPLLEKTGGASYLASAHYNIGLLLVKMKQYEKARKHARIAYQYRYPLPGLKDMLKAAGYPL